MDMLYGILLALIPATIRMSLPILFASSGGYFSEKSGVPQIALEAYLLTGAFSAAATVYFSGSLILGYFVAAIVALSFSQIFNILIFLFKANAIVIGTGMNLLAMGLIPLVSKILFDSTGSTPVISNGDLFSEYSLYTASIVTLFMLLGCYWLAEKSKWGLQIKFAGEKSDALRSIGISPTVRRWQAVSFSALVTGLGGAILSTYLASAYSPMMSAGRGFIALAAVIFAGWNLKKSWIVVLFFGFAEALQIQLQNMTLSFYDLVIKIPNEFIQMLPYVATLIALLILRHQQLAPKEIGQNL